MALTNLNSVQGNTQAFEGKTCCKLPYAIWECINIVFCRIFSFDTVNTRSLSIHRSVLSMVRPTCKLRAIPEWIGPVFPTHWGNLIQQTMAGFHIKTTFLGLLQPRLEIATIYKHFFHCPFVRHKYLFIILYLYNKYSMYVAYISGFKFWIGEWKDWVKDHLNRTIQSTLSRLYRNLYLFWE